MFAFAPDLIGAGQWRDRHWMSGPGAAEVPGGRDGERQLLLPRRPSWVSGRSPRRPGRGGTPGLDAAARRIRELRQRGLLQPRGAFPCRWKEEGRCESRGAVRETVAPRAFAFGKPRCCADHMPAPRSHVPGQTHPAGIASRTPRTGSRFGTAARTRRPAIWRPKRREISHCPNSVPRSLCLEPPPAMMPAPAPPDCPAGMRRRLRNLVPRPGVPPCAACMSWRFVGAE